MKDGEVLGNGYKVEEVAGEETLVPDNDSTLEGIALALERAIRVQKLAPALARIKEHDILATADPAITATQI